MCRRDEAKMLAAGSRLRRLRTIALPIALLWAAAGQSGVSLAAEHTEPAVERIAIDRVLVTWPERVPTDVYVGTKPASGIESMRLVSDDDRDGRHELQLIDDSRPYFLLISEPGSKRRVAERVLALEKGSNFRDVGGYAAANGQYVRWGLIYRSGAMPELTDRDYRLLGQLGIRVLCDLRSKEERELAPTRWKAEPAARYVAVDYPASTIYQGLTRNDPNSIVNDDAKKAAGSANHNLYREWPTSLAPQFRGIFDALLAGEAPLAFNCSAGQDRTGVATALVLSALGVPRDVILSDYHLSTVYRRPEFERGNADFAKLANDNIVARYYAETSHRGAAALKPKPLYDPAGRARVAATFNEIESRWGSVEGYLAEVLAVDSKDIARLRALYLE